MPSAIVIGGGPAGSVASLLLARAGWHVTLVEQHRFPRDKVCGECLSALGATVLARLALADALPGIGAVRLNRTLLHAPAGVCVAVPLPRPMWGVSRAGLDRLLLDAAAGAGVRLLQPARCESLTPGSPPTITVRELVTNATDVLTGDFVLVADGKSALLDERPPPATGDLGIKAHFTNVDGPRDAVELFGLPGCYGGLAPIEGGRWNAAFSVPAARVRLHSGDLSGLFANMTEENPTLRRRLACGRRVGRWLASPLPRFGVRGQWAEGVIPLGNAAAAIEPIGGEGMGLAMRSAELAAQALLSGSTASLRSRFLKLWRARYVACRAGAIVASTPHWARAAARLLSATPAPLRLGMALMGK